MKKAILILFLAVFFIANSFVPVSDPVVDSKPAVEVVDNITSTGLTVTKLEPGDPYFEECVTSIELTDESGTRCGTGAWYHISVDYTPQTLLMGYGKVWECYASTGGAYTWGSQGYWDAYIRLDDAPDAYKISLYVGASGCSEVSDYVWIYTSDEPDDPGTPYGPSNPTYYQTVQYHAINFPIWPADPTECEWSITGGSYQIMGYSGTGDPYMDIRFTEYGATYYIKTRFSNSCGTTDWGPTKTVNL